MVLVYARRPGFLKVVVLLANFVIKIYAVLLRALALKYMVTVIILALLPANRSGPVRVPESSATV
jgi:hypothetical protein